MATHSFPGSKAGKCSNFGNCSVADARKTVEVPNGMDFVCSECQKPLLLTETEVKAGLSKPLFIAVLLVVLLIAGAVAWFLLKGKKSPDEAPPAPAQTVAPQPAAPPVIIPQTQAPPQSPTGHCSEADEKAGLCKIAR